MHIDFQVTPNAYKNNGQINGGALVEHGSGGWGHEFGVHGRSLTWGGSDAPCLDEVPRHKKMGVLSIQA